MGCHICLDPDGFSCFPVYGVGPHRHDSNLKTIPLPRSEWPANYLEDPDCPGMGTYWCPACGNGKPQSRYDIKPRSIK